MFGGVLGFSALEGFLAGMGHLHHPPSIMGAIVARNVCSFLLVTSNHQLLFRYLQGWQYAPLPLRWDILIQSTER